MTPPSNFKAGGSVDPAILRALSLDAEEVVSANLTSHGGSGFARTCRLSCVFGEKKGEAEEGKGKGKGKGKEGEKVYFVKMGEGRGSEVMFTGEHESLNAIHKAVPKLCPKSYAHGKLDEKANGYFLITDFIVLGSSTSSTSTSSSKPKNKISLASKLAKLHSLPTPIPDGYSSPQFGFPVSTCCGDTVQENSFRDSWAEFFAECRLRAVLRSCGGADDEMVGLVEKVIGSVVPKLLADEHLRSPDGAPIRPALVHGDLWSGNRGCGIIYGGGGGSVDGVDEEGAEGGEGEEPQEVIFDPSSCWAHSEFEFGIMNMFGGFGKAFREEYWSYKPRDEPVGEWEDRVLLYELYHHLNHYSIFGAGYRSGAVGIMKRLIAKYGGG